MQRSRSRPRLSSRNTSTRRRRAGSVGRLPQLIGAVLREYADRGVFRGLSDARAANGLTRYRFIWLTRRPLVLAVSRDGRVLTFPALFPDVNAVPGLRTALMAEARAQASTALLAHRRVDRRRVTIAMHTTKGDLTCRLSIAGSTTRDVDYGVRAALRLVHELFLFLHEMYPDYLTSHFGVSQE